MAHWPPGGGAEKLKTIENGREVSYLDVKIHQTTKIIDSDPSYGRNLDEIAYFDSSSP